jgi:hypothetical protein
MRTAGELPLTAARGRERARSGTWLVPRNRTAGSQACPDRFTPLSGRSGLPDQGRNLAESGPAAFGGAMREADTPLSGFRPIFTVEKVRFPSR